MKASGIPKKITTDKSGTNKTAMNEINARSKISVIVLKVKYLNNIVEQDHRAIKRVTSPMLIFKSFWAVKCVQVDIELMHIIRKVQMVLKGSEGISYANQL
jgi:transposase-like protein